jgi:hypothetical protein
VEDSEVVVVDAVVVVTVVVVNVEANVMMRRSGFLSPS